MILNFIFVNADPLSESRSSDIYVPRDEAFSELKEATFGINTVKSLLHALVPSIETALVDKTLGFPYFTAIDTLFNEGIELPKDTEKPWYLQTLLPRTVKAATETKNDLLRFEAPEMFDSMVLSRLCPCTHIIRMFMILK